MPAYSSSNAQQNTSRAIDCFAGAILIASALLKAASPSESATLAAAYGLPTWSSLLLIQLEVVLGVLLITGVAGGAGRIVALLAFVLFACFSAYRALAGYESCGCFGAVQVHPWITFAIDLLLISVLTWNVRESAEAPPQTRPNIAFAMASWLLLGGTACGLALAFQPHTLAGDSVSISTGGLVILEPETWSGKKLPIAQHISPTVDLSQGNWTLLLYHHDCPDCQAALPHYQQLAAQPLGEGARRRLLLVEVPPYGDVSQHGRANFARLSDKVEWFVQAPVEIQLSEGTVQQASRDLPSIAPFRGQLSYIAR